MGSSRFPMSAPSLIPERAVDPARLDILVVQRPTLLYTLSLSPIDIGHGDDVDVRHLRRPGQMALADLADADHADLDVLYHRWLPFVLDCATHLKTRPPTP
jgi:hypothetical protein